jgi:hypothetical protein
MLEIASPYLKTLLNLLDKHISICSEADNSKDSFVGAKRHTFEIDSGFCK